MKENRLYIRFHNEDGSFDVFRSPGIDSPISLHDSEDLDDLVVDGDDEEEFYIACDAEGHGDNIIWLMFEPYDPAWVRKLMKVWARRMGFQLPPWNRWSKIPSVEEAYQ